MNVVVQEWNRLCQGEEKKRKAIKFRPLNQLTAKQTIKKYLLPNHVRVYRIEMKNG